MNRKYEEIVKDSESADFETMEGWNIKEVGMTYNKKGMTEGGLTFILEKNGETKQIILGYTELGIWKEYEGTII